MGHNMQVEVEELGPCKKLLKVEVPAQRIKETLDKQYGELAPKATVPGFRQGKAPRRLLELRFGEQVLDEVKESLIAESSQEALEKEGLKPLTEPKVDNVQFDQDKVLSFELTVETRPVFSLEPEDYKGISLKKPKSEVTDEDVSRVLEDFRNSNATLDTVSEGGAKKRDLVIADVKLSSPSPIWTPSGAGGEEIASYENTLLSTEEDRLPECAAPGLSEALLGATAGEVRALEITLDDKFPKEEHRGKKARVELKVNEVKRIRLPEPGDELAQAAGYKTLADMKEAIRAGIKRSKENLAQEMLKSALADTLLSKVDFEIPQDIAESMGQDILKRRQIYLQYRGVPQEEIAKAEEELSTRSREEAAKSLKLYLLYEHIADKEKIFATEEDVEERIEALATARQVTAARVRDYIQQQNLLPQLRSQIREEKIIAFLLNEAQVEEVSPDEAAAAQAKQSSKEEKERRPSADEKKDAPSGASED